CWPSRTPAWTDSHLRHIPAHDWAWSAKLIARRGTLYLHPHVRCDHAVSGEKRIPGYGERRGVSPTCDRSGTWLKWLTPSGLNRDGSRSIKERLFPLRSLREIPPSFPRDVPMPRG